MIYINGLSSPDVAHQSHRGLRYVSHTNCESPDFDTICSSSIWHACIAKHFRAPMRIFCQYESKITNMHIKL